MSLPSVGRYASASTRRLSWLVLLLLALIALVALVAPAADPESPPAELPNIIVFYVDDLGYLDIGSNGSPVIQTPNIDRFAAEGVRFTAAYAGAPLCSPSRAALLTGRFASRVGVFDTIRPDEDMRLPDAEITIAEMLAAAGYQSLHLGKWHVDNRRPGQRSPQRHGFNRSSEDWSMAWNLVHKGIDWLAKADPDKPFFMYVAPYEPHHPVEDFAPPAYRRPYESDESEAAARTVPYMGYTRPTAEWDKRTAYFGAVSQMDDSFGLLLDYLDESGLRDNTFIFFMSDNGPERTVPWSFGSPGPFTGSKLMLYEGGIRVPAAAQWPAAMKPGLVTDEPIHSVDVLPTIAEIVGVAPPADRAIDGVSFLPALRGEPLERAKPLFWMYWRAPGRPGESNGGMHAALRDGRWKLMARLEPLKREWTLMQYLEMGEFEAYRLFDLVADPAESKDLSGSQPEVMNRLKPKLLALHRETVAEAPKWDLEHRRFLAHHVVRDPQ